MRPKLRFKEFDDSWEISQLGSVAAITSGGTPNRENLAYWNGNIPWISTSLVDFNHIYKAEEFISKEGLNNSSAKLFPIGTILVAMYGQGKTRGKVAVLNIEAATNQACAAILPGPHINSEYIFQNLTNRYDEIRGLSNDGGQQNLSGSIIKSITISFPSLPEQQKIASFLSAVDEKIRQLKRKKELLEKYKKGVMQQIFERKIRFKDEKSKAFPEWEEKRLGEYLVYRSERNTDRKIELVLSVSNKKGFITQDEQFDGYSVASKDLSAYKLVYKNDIAYNPSRINVGSIARLMSHEKGIVSPMYIVFSLRSDLDPIFFENYIETHRFKHLIRVGCSGSVRDTLNLEVMANFKLSFPSLPEQQKIASFLSSLDKKIELVSRQVEKAQEFKKGLLQQMFV